MIAPANKEARTVKRGKINEGKMGDDWVKKDE